MTPEEFNAKHGGESYQIFKNLLEGGMSYAKIGATFGISKARVSQLIKEFGLQRKVTFT